MLFCYWMADNLISLIYIFQLPIVSFEWNKQTAHETLLGASI